jgi:hypothetical protein
VAASLFTVSKVDLMKDFQRRRQAGKTRSGSCFAWAGVDCADSQVHSVNKSCPSAAHLLSTSCGEEHGHHESPLRALHGEESRLIRLGPEVSQTDMVWAVVAA